MPWSAAVLASAAADPLHEFCARSARSVASVSTTWRIALWASGTVGVLAVWAVGIEARLEAIESHLAALTKELHGLATALPAAAKSVSPRQERLKVSG